MDYNSIRERKFNAALGLEESIKEAGVGVNIPDTTATFVFFIFFAIVGVAIDVYEIGKCCYDLKWDRVNEKRASDENEFTSIIYL